MEPCPRAITTPAGDKDLQLKCAKPAGHTGSHVTYLEIEFA